jgi:hypothetical protein
MYEISGIRWALADCEVSVLRSQIECVLSRLPSGSESDQVLDLVATGFNKPTGDLLGRTMRTQADVEAASDAFLAHHALESNAVSLT